MPSLRVRSAIFTDSASVESGTQLRRCGASLGNAVSELSQVIAGEPEGDRWEYTLRSSSSIGG
jgi:hypothetical protein